MMFNFNTLMISLILLLYHFKTSNSLPQEEVVTEGAGDSALPQPEAVSVGDSVNGSPVDSNTDGIPHSVEVVPDFSDSVSATDVSAESVPELGDSVHTETLPDSSGVHAEAIPEHVADGTHSGMNIVTETMPKSDAIDSHSDAPPELDDTGGNTDVAHESGHSIDTDAVPETDMSASGANADGSHEARQAVDSGPAADSVGSVNSELPAGSGGSSNKLLQPEEPALTESSEQSSDAGNSFNSVHLSDPVDSESAEPHVVSGDGSNDNGDGPVPPNSNSVIVSDSPPETEFEALAGQSTEAIAQTIDNSGSHTEIIGGDNNAIADIETIIDGSGAVQEYTEMIADSDAHERTPESIDEDNSGTDSVHSVAGNGQEFADHIDSTDSTHSFDGTDSSDGNQSLDESGDTESHESSDFTEDISGSDGGFVAGTVDPKANTIGDSEEAADSTEDITEADAVTEPFGDSDLTNTNGSKGCTKADNGSTTTGPDTTTVLEITSGPPANAVGNVLFKEALLVPKRERRIIARYKVIIPVIIPQVRVRVPLDSNTNSVESSPEVSSLKRKKSRKSRKSRKKSRKSPAKSKKSGKSKRRSKRNASESSHSMKNSRPSSRSGSKSKVKSKPGFRFLFWKIKSESKPSARKALSSKKSLKPAKRSGKGKYESKPAPRSNLKSGSTLKSSARSQIF